jgi:hypothetical protein
VIIFEPLDLRLLVAKRTGRILPDRKCLKFHIERIVNQKLTDQGLSLLENQFDGLCGLNQSNLPGYNSQDTRLVSAGDQTRRRRLRKETPKAWPSLLGREDTGLAFKLENASVDIGFPCKERCIVCQKLGREVVGTIDDDVVLWKDFKGILGSQSFLISYNLNIRIDSADGLLGRFCLRSTHVSRAMQHLPLKVCQIDLVRIDNPQGSHSSSGEVESGWAAQASCSNQKDPGL